MTNQILACALDVTMFLGTRIWWEKLLHGHPSFLVRFYFDNSTYEGIK
jgi:hypothetical protein